MDENQIANLPAILSGLTCPQCQSRKYSKNGKDKNVQKYKCKKCGKNYRSTTGSSIHRIHKKSQISQYINSMLQGQTLRKAAKETGISLPTAFSWRHKLLKALSQNQTTELLSNNTISAFSLPYSEKGARHKTHHNRKSTVTSILQTDTAGKTNIHIINKKAQLPSNIMSQFSAQTTYFKGTELPRTCKNNIPQETRSTTNVQIRQTHIQLQNWIDKFRGVATKYLQHYWAWFVQMCEFEQTNHHQSLTQKCILKA